MRSSKHRTSHKIYERYTVKEYAKILRERHRLNAGEVASNRYDKTEDPAAAEFYNRILCELDHV